MLGDKDLRQLGLMYLRTASEELICPKEELPVTRKNELLQLFSAQIPQVFNLLASKTQILFFDQYLYFL